MRRDHLKNSTGLSNEPTAPQNIGGVSTPAAKKWTYASSARLYVYISAVYYAVDS